MQWMGLVICCGIAVKFVGMLKVSVRKMRALNMTMTLNGKGR